MRKNKGITLIALVITIVVLLILASVGLDYGLGSITDAKDEVYLSELGMIKQAVLEHYTMYLNTQNAEKYILGNAISYTEFSDELALAGSEEQPKAREYTLEKEGKRDPTYYYRITKAELEKMGITQVEEDSYIVNYTTGEVFNEKIKKTTSGEILYVYSVEM